nr:immunoglobulin light chain junction region [Macaca mulatta]
DYYCSSYTTRDTFVF